LGAMEEADSGSSNARKEDKNTRISIACMFPAGTLPLTKCKGFAPITSTLHPTRDFYRYIYIHIYISCKCLCLGIFQEVLLDTPIISQCYWTIELEIKRSLLDIYCFRSNLFYLTKIHLET
jgi:hypothetical protein